MKPCADGRLRACFLAATVAVALCLTVENASAGLLRDRMEERRNRRVQQEQQHGQPQNQHDELDGEDASHAAGALPPGVTVVRDVSYGSDPAQRFDVYRPAHAQDTTAAPVIFMVHGGGWRRGDKTMSTTVENKRARWVPKGFIFISVNYPMLPHATPLQQAEHVARALAAAQRMAPSWGGNPASFILMGHSAGSHLISLLSADPSAAFGLGAQAWRGSVLLDSAAFDVVQIMQGRHMRLYDPAFGRDIHTWRAASPTYVLKGQTQPMLAVCSTRRTESCAQAKDFAAKANALGGSVQVLGEDLSHKEINQQLGTPGPYTDAVESFIAALDPAARRLLER